MSNAIGKNLTLTIFGESHGPAIGGILDGLPGGVKIDEEVIAEYMAKRKAVGSISTGRKEADKVKFLSGVKDGYSQGTPIALVVENTNVRRNDYGELKDSARPGHADYSGYVKYNGYADASGGGHFSGRLTAIMVAAGAIALEMLKSKDIYIASHIASIYDIKDRDFNENSILEDINILDRSEFPTLNKEAGEAMKACIEEARLACDSLGGILETIVIGMPAGIGEPEFDSVESKLAHAIFAIPAVKGLEFGQGFKFATMKGSQANDPFAIKDGKVVTTTNNNGGINGGITNGMPIYFRTVIKPTPSIAQAQKTVNYVTKEEKMMTINGRHDPCIVHRARIVVDAMSALTLVDLLMERYGREYFGGAICNMD